MHPIDWKQDTLRDGIILISGQHIAVAHYSGEPIGIPYLTGPADFNGKNPNETKYTDQPKACCKAGDILITVKGAGTGTIAIADKNYCISRQLMAVRPTRFDTRFIFYVLESNFERYNSVAVGLIPGITREDILSTPLEVPPIREQKEIAHILLAWDSAIENTERLIEAKEKRFSWLIKSLISDQSSHWNHLPAEKIFKSISDKNSGNEELLSVTQDRGVIPRTMLEGRVMSPEGNTEAYKLVKEGDFVISLRSFQGGIEYSRYQGLISPAYTVLRPILKIYDEFYRYFFKSYLFIEKYLGIAVIGIRDGKQISVPDFMTVKIPCPLLEQQKKIVFVLNAARQEIDILRKQAEAYRKQKRGLMQKLLTGQWRVKITEKVEKWQKK